MRKKSKAAVALAALAAILLCAACNMEKAFDLEYDRSGRTAAVTDGAVTTLPGDGTTLIPTTSALPDGVSATSPLPDAVSTTAPAPVTTTEAPAPQLSVQEVIDLYANAVNLTRGYQGTLSVHHTETFSGDVVEAQPLGALTTTLANTVVGMISDPHDATLTFTNGIGVNEEGETVPILLPKGGTFSLPAEGVRNAFMDTANGMRHVVINLVSETVDYGVAPYYNAGAIGYLDTSRLDFKIVRINSCAITYTGSVIDAYIRDDGYLDSVNYTVNLSVSANVTGLGITGSGVMEGVEYESWDILW